MVSIASLSTRQTPPLRVPMRFFLSVPLFMGLAGLMLLLSDSLALQGRWTPQVLALTHLWVLGMMLLAMLGALQQVVPVLLGVTIVHAEWVGFGSYLLLVPGILALVGGFLTGETELFLVAAPALGGGVLLVVLAVLEALTRSPSVHATAWGIRLALIALLVTVGLGSWLALGSGGIVVLRREWTDLHLGWGLLGWSVLLLSAVAWHVVPMFQVTPRYPSLLMRSFAPLLLGSLLLWMAGRWWFGVPWVALAGIVAISVLLTLFALTTLWLQARRRRRIPDASLDFWRLSMISLLLGILLWWLRRSGLGVPDLLLGELLAAGFIGAAIIGMLYKIVPFLVWLHLTNRAQEKLVLPKGIPNLKQVISSDRSRLLFRLYLVWMLLLAALPFQPHWLTMPAGLLLVLIALLLGWHLLDAMRLYRKHLARIEMAAEER